MRLEQYKTPSAQQILLFAHHHLLPGQLMGFAVQHGPDRLAYVIQQGVQIDRQFMFVRGDGLFENRQEAFQAVVLGQRTDERLGFGQFGGQFLKVAKLEIKQAVPVEKIPRARDINRLYVLFFPAELGAEII
jgi:hypothetical protein